MLRWTTPIRTIVAFLAVPTIAQFAWPQVGGTVYNGRPSTRMLSGAISGAQQRPDPRKREAHIAWNARVLGVQIGTSYMDQLVRRLGRGTVELGTHPESAQEWKLSNGLVVWADASYSDGKGAILDTLDLSSWHGKLKDARTRRGEKLSFGPFGDLDSSMDRIQVVDALRPVLGKPSATKAEVTWDLRGPHGWPTHAVASFSSGRLERIFLETEVDIHWNALRRTP